MTVQSSYRWVVLAACLAQLAIAYTAWYSFTVFLVELVSQLRWSRAETAFGQSIMVVVSGLGSPLAGTLVDRYGPRPSLFIGGTLLGGGVAFCSQMQATWQFYLLYGLAAGLGTALCGWVTTAAVANTWFPRQRAMAMGVSSAGIGVGIMVCVPLAQQLIILYGWRSAYLILGVMTGVGLGIVGLITRLPSRAASPAGGAVLVATDDPLVVDRAWAGTVWSVGRAVRTSRFWLVVAAFFCGSVGTQQILVHQVAILADAGYERMLAALAVGVVGIFSITGKLSWGPISERIGREVAYTIGMGLVVGSIGLIGLASGRAASELVFAFAVLLGLGYAVTGVLSPATVADCFQGRHFGAVFGVVGIFHGLGGAVGAWTAGLLRDTSGSYALPMILSVVTCLSAALMCWLAAPRKVRMVPGAAGRSRAALV